MIGDKQTEQLLKEYYLAIESNNPEKIEVSQYNLLLDAGNLLEVVINYIYLSTTLKIKFDFGESIIPKGTLLYRIRKFDSAIDFNNSSEWTFPPHKPENRANKQGESALYLASSEEICLLETHIKKGEKYAFATYQCTDDIKLGGFFSVQDKYNLKQLIGGIALNAFLIAPSRGENNNDLFDFLQKSYGEIELSDLKDWKKSFTLPYKFALLNKREEYYKITNQICDILKEEHTDGIRYSSCFMPVETIGITSNAYNVVLYDDGIKKIEFLKSEIKENCFNDTAVEIAKIICKTGENE